MKELRASTAAAIEQVPTEQVPVAQTAAAESRSAVSLRLQQESLALLDSGQSTQALQADRPGAGARSRAGLGPMTIRPRCASNWWRRAISGRSCFTATSSWTRRSRCGTACWQIDPGYEPAVAYRARALELKRRLRQY